MKINSDIRSILLLIPACAAALAAVSCMRGNRSSRDNGAQQADTVSARLPHAVTCVRRAVADSNAGMFASSVAYPLERPYPLKDITDSAEMVKYYPTLVDDSLRSVITRAGEDRWTDEGYMGWTLDNGRYIWIDDSVYAVNYTSAREDSLRNALSAREMESLEASLRQGWTPAFCLYGLDNGSLYRVDRDDRPHRTEEAADSADVDLEQEVMRPGTRHDSESAVYRLTVYRREDNPHGKPYMVMTGRLVTEGSEGTRIYYFNDREGDSAEYAYDQIAEDDVPQIIVMHSGHRRHHPVRRVYWLDYIDRRH